jgi:hypothetical protein
VLSRSGDGVPDPLEIVGLSQRFDIDLGKSDGGQSGRQDELPFATACTASRIMV